MGMLESLKKISDILQRLKEREIIGDFALVGGLSVAVWGVPRATLDIDLLVLVTAEHREAFIAELNAHGLHPLLSRGDFTDPVPFLIRAESDNVPIDMICASKTWEKDAVEQAVPVKVKDFTVPVVPAEYLIIMKLKAGGPKDILDVAELLQSPYINKQKLEEMADRFRVRKKMERIRGRQ